MKRSFLAAAVCAAPLIVAAAATPASAQLNITGSTSTPVATATAVNGQPADIDISSGGSVGVTSPGVAVTLNSNNSVLNAGEIGFTGIDNATGIQVIGGNTGAVTNTGTILLTETYTAATDINTGLLTGPFALGTNRIGIQVVGPGVFNGGISQTGTITVNGNNSEGVSIQAPITGDYRMLAVTPATSSAAATVVNGTITMLGDNTVGLQVTNTGAIGGNVGVSTVTATGAGAQAVVLDGNVGGVVNVSGTVTATGYRALSRATNPTAGAEYTAAELQQGGSAVIVGGNVGGGIIVSAPPLVLSTTNLDQDANGVPDSLQGAGAITAYGAAPAMVIGQAGAVIDVGKVGAGNGVVGEGGAGAYGFVVQGDITGAGTFDQYTSPFLPSPVAGNALQVGAGSGSATIEGGIYNTGQIQGEAYGADATAIHFEAGGATPLILNDGVIRATSTQVNSNSTVQVATLNAAGGAVVTTVPALPVTVSGILIDKGATVGAISNNSGIFANVTGNGGVGGTAGAIIDNSGTLASVANTGTISAQYTNTVSVQPLPTSPTNAIAGRDPLTAIDMSAGTGPQSITQSASTNPAITGAAAWNSTSTYTVGQIVNFNGVVYQATSSAGVAIDPVDYPGTWKEIGATTPTIAGSIYFGNGGSTLNVGAGSVTGNVIQLGTGVNTVTVAGAAGSGVTGASVSGALLEGPAKGGGNSTLTINVDNGSLTDTNPNAITANSVNVGAHGLLVVAADPVNGTSTRFITSGASTFATGASVGLTLLSIPSTTQQTYTILQTTGAGTLTAGTFGTGTVASAPWLYLANAAYVPPSGAGAPSEIQLTVTQRTQAQLGFNNAEEAALNAVLNAAPQNAAIQSALLAQTNQAGLKSVYDQLLPNQGQALFDSLDAAVQKVGAMTGTDPDPGSRTPGTSLWVQEVNERVERSGIETVGSTAKLFGVVGGYEHIGSGGGAAGLTLAYFNDDETENSDQIGGGVVANVVEAGAYYRRSMGAFTMSARGGVGYAFFSGNRIFLSSNAEETAHADWGGLFYDGHAGAAYERHLGRYYARPEISADYLRLDEGSHQEAGGGPGFDLAVGPRDSTRLSGQALMVIGREWGKTPGQGSGSWLRTELRGGFREILAGNVGDTVATFDGGNPFTLAPENDQGGWATFGFSIKGGSQFSYLALEGDVDLRQGEQRYDLRIAGRSMF